MKQFLKLTMLLSVICGLLIACKDDDDLSNRWISVSAGHSHTVAIGEEGSLWAWGYNYNGELGSGTTTDSLVPIRITN